MWCVRPSSMRKKLMNEGVKSAAEPLQQMQLEALRNYLKEKGELLGRVMVQTRARIIEGNKHFQGKIFSLFEPTTEAIRKGKAGKETEFGKLVKIQECEEGLIMPVSPPRKTASPESTGDTGYFPLSRPRSVSPPGHE